MLAGVGVKLYYPDETIQHAGITIGVIFAIIYNKRIKEYFN